MRAKLDSDENRPILLIAATPAGTTPGTTGSLGGLFGNKQADQGATKATPAPSNCTLECLILPSKINIPVQFSPHRHQLTLVPVIYF